MKKLLGEINKSTIIVGDFQFPLSVTEQQADKKSTQPQKTEHIHCAREQQNPCTVQGHVEHIKIDHILGHKTPLTYMKVLEPHKVYPLAIIEVI